MNTVYSASTWVSKCNYKYRYTPCLQEPPPLHSPQKSGDWTENMVLPCMYWLYVGIYISLIYFCPTFIYQRAHGRFYEHDMKENSRLGDTLDLEMVINDEENGSDLKTKGIKLGSTCKLHG